MLLTLQVPTILAVSIAMALSLAHALEFPGKLRLSKETYLNMQMIYYPGFTIGGMVGEAGGLLATVALLWATENTVAWRLILAALLCLFVMHAIYWLVIHPVNNFWLRNKRRSRLEQFFLVHSCSTCHWQKTGLERIARSLGILTCRTGGLGARGISADRHSRSSVKHSRPNANPPNL